MPSAGGTNFHPQSGHPGVTWCSERRTWRICYAPEPGKRVTKSFNPRHYGGLEQALQAAIEYLREQKAKLSLYRPNGNSNKGENSSSMNIKKMNDKLNDMHHSTASVLEMDMNNKCGVKHNGPNWNNNIPYNGFEYGSGLGNSELNNINSELLPGFDGGKVGNMNQNLFGLENSSEQWNAATAAAVIAHAINTSKSNGVNQKRKANCEYSASMRAPSTKASKSSNLYGEHTYFNSQSSQTNIEISGMGGYCCDCYYNNSNNNNNNNIGSNSTNGSGNSKTNDEQNSTISNQMDNMNNIHCNNNHNHMIGHNSFHQYSCSQSSKSTVSTNNVSNSNNNLGNGNNNSIHPFIYDYNDQSNVNDLMNIRTPKYVNYQRHSGNQNLDDDLLHPSIASSSPLGKVFQSTPYSNIDNYDTILTPNMRSGNSQNHSSGLNINSGRYCGGNGSIFESDGGVITNSNKSSNNNKSGYNNNNSTINGNNNSNNNNGNNNTNTGCNHSNQINPSYSSCNSCISNTPQNEFGDFNTPYSSWFEGLGSCYSEIEDTFLSKGSHLLPVGSLGPYSFQPYKEPSHADASGKSIVESILLPLSTTSCGTSTEPQLSNDLILDSCQNINIYQNNNNTIGSNGNNKNLCLNDAGAI